MTLADVDILVATVVPELRADELVRWPGSQRMSPSGAPGQVAAIAPHQAPLLPLD